MIKAGIIGGAGYTGGEMLRILVNHPDVEIAFVHSKSNAGNFISDVHTDLFGDTDLKFCGNEVLEALSLGEGLGEADILFLCVGHGDARKFLEANPVAERIKIIDLSQDFRLKANSSLSGRLGGAFVYGLPELNRDSIKTAKNIANPGCFATGIQLGLLPLAAKGLLKSEVHINATTGSTGAGQSLSATSHFSWRNNNLSVYKVFTHQHLQEISESLNQLQPGFLPVSELSLLERAAQKLTIIPQRGDFTRGILAAMYTDCDLSLEEVQNLYEDYYANEPFTHVSRKNIDLKQVVNTNKCLIYLEKHGNRLFIVSITDNLLKGASGQAVQNMNLLFGLDERAGLRLKAVGF
ncbi:N-acetyl-gamma-glutamyl-phosphate reductase [Pedobacter sp. BS3]|uniref:N-acetyl-gamma-glutamyl-phosphate reductase n=1 Tax=Pedobacter sp. BS3 TaxID=2567937 RepID=UPI0011EF6F5A|nr:N-acetyl-gamma-glutamyl-phosphate reductase [Pedobacter sp. BS3]TZF81708.1 N-acetyl-gamma-glutamyl-phosphate reductase [Pedobacter sp. BS3]